MSHAPHSRFRRFVSLLGPGILVAATGVGAGDLATAAISGSRLGLTVLWAAVLGCCFKFALNEGLTRYQLVSGETLLQGAMTRLGWFARVLFGTYLVLWSFFVANSLMSAAGISLQAMWPLFDKPVDGQLWFGIASSLLGVLLVRVGGFAVFEKVMAVCIGIMFIVVIGTAIVLKPDLGEFLHGTFVPSISAADPEALKWTVALMGGIGGTLTVLCYGYWIREKGREGVEYLNGSRIDLASGYIMTMIFGLAMVVIGTKIEVHGKGASLIVDLANELEKPLGPAGRWAFLLGSWGAIFSSLLGVWQSVPYVFSDYLGLLHTRRGETPPPVHTRSRSYRGYLWAIALIPMLGLRLPFTEIQKVYALFGAAFMPILALTLLLLNGSRLPDPRYRNKPITTAFLVGVLAFFAWVGVRDLL
ncbi:MAG: Nramp family divalent metal transporter [Planctomycetota bacterium]